MAKYTTAITGYYQEASQIEQFVKSEIGTYKDYLKNIHKARLAMKKVYNSTSPKKRDTPAMKNKLNAAWESAYKKFHGEHHKLHERFLMYEKTFDNLFVTKEAIGKDTLKKLMDMNKDTQNDPLFQSPQIKWRSEAGAKAIKKFTDMLLKNDMKKLEYYKNCLNKSNRTIKLQDVLDCPTPVTKKATTADMSDLAKKARELSEKLNKTESRLHSNSSEFIAMKAALKSLNEGLSNGISSDELGSRLEALQESSMKYVKTKGVGMQSSQRGKERMDAALDLCSLSAEYMDFYASKARRAELESYEKENFEQILSEEIENEYIVPEEELSNEEEIDSEASL